MAEKDHPKILDEFDLGSEDLFFGASNSSPRKEVPKQDQEEAEDEAKQEEEQAETGNRTMLKAAKVLFQAEASVASPLRLPASMSPCPLAHSSPRIIRKESEDGTVEEYWINTPVIRRSKSLAMRRVTSELHCSPHLQGYSPIPAKRRRFTENKSSALQRVKSEDRLSEGSRGSSSGQESVSIETDDEGGSQLENVQSEQGDPDGGTESRRPGPSRPTNSELDDSVSAVVRIPFQNMLMRQESELFEHLSKGPEEALMVEGKSEDWQREFKLHRRWNEKRQKETVDGRAGQCRPGGERSLFGDSEGQPEEQRIKSAVERLTHHGGGVIADGTVPYALPCSLGKKEELMFITADTLADLMTGGFRDVVDHFEVIDCRYPYEYEGGHVAGAVNMYKADSIAEIMSWRTPSDSSGDSNKRMVLIFHCEFSSQRGPSMMRLLRKTDRQYNSHCYPHLCHPEIYLLSGGYKVFYEQYPHLCDPSAYVPMSHHDYQHELRMFRSRATTWHGKDVLASRHSHSLIL